MRKTTCVSEYGSARVCVCARTSERVKASEVVYVLVNQRLPVEPPWVQQGEFKFIVSSIQLLTTNTGKL